MPFVDLKNVKLYYEDEGVGKETIVFGHSLLFNLRMFDNQVNALKFNYRCVRFDFRGQGKSEVTANGYDLNNLTKDIAAFIKTLNCHPCHFIGFSMGGMVGMRLAVEYPQLLKSLILIDTSSEPEPKEKIKQNLLMLWIARNISINLVANKVMSMFFSKNFLKDKTRYNIKKEYRNYLLNNDKIGMTRSVKSILYRERYTENLKKISVPTLILVGENDMLTTYDKAELMNQEIKHSVLKIVLRAAHMTTVEEPLIINSLINDFLNSIK